VKAFALPEPKTPPEAMQLWDIGDNPTDYGVHRWTERSIAEVLERYNERGNPLMVDVEHNGAAKEGEPTVTGGYAKLEIRAGAPWLVFEWSAYAVEQIATGQRRFLSPEYDVDADTGEITKLYRVSLVADPGTHRARVLASTGNNKEKLHMNLAMILAALKAALAAEDAAVAKESIASLVAELSKMSESGAPAEEAVETASDEELKGDVQTAGDEVVQTAGEEMPEKAAAEEPKPEVAPASDDVVKCAADAVRTVRNAQRDLLLQTDGDRLDPSIRVWASSQPYEIVKGLLAAAPARKGSVQRTAATRGATHGNVAASAGLRGDELAQFQAAMGTVKAAAKVEPFESGSALVLPLVKPSDFRIAAAAKAGK
jgi:hypothetical protein